MERKRPKGIKKSATAPLAIIPVDGTRIRQKIKREYEKVRRDLDAARADLERFEREDAPAFSRWIDHQFGALIAELSQTTRRLQELENLLADVEAEMFYSGASERQAYARVMNRQKNAQPSPETGEEEEADSQEDRRDGKHRSSGFQQDFEDQQPGWKSFFGSGKEKNGPMGRKPANPTARLKELYRALARRLHPDAQKEMTA